ncbi:hypothetical protein ACW9UR_20785 [Halovulum sp. GXIMD14794]
MTRSETVIVAGIMGWYPYGGIAWQYLHYMEGLRRLGFDVVYFEDTGYWAPDNAVSFITDIMRRYGFDGKWFYRSVSAEEPYGMDDDTFARVLSQAAAVFNVTASTVLKDEFKKVPLRAHIETDPVEFQLKYNLYKLGKASAEDERFTEYLENIDNHTHHFTFGENFGASDCPVPIEDYSYIPTRQPVVTDWWAGRDRASAAVQPKRYTTIANWDQEGEKDVEWDGRPQRWSKSAEFRRFIDLPKRASGRFELALANLSGKNAKITAEEIGALTEAGWHLEDAVRISDDADTYRDYITGSSCEFTVAKSQYHILRSGWFSDRSACYLAAGAPVITQDTGFGNILPTGLGLYPFTTMEDAVAATEAIEADYAANSDAALQIGREYFEAEKVVGAMTSAMGLT